MKLRGDVSTRHALNTLKDARTAGKAAKQIIIKAVDDLKAFNRLETSLSVAKHVVTAATYGGAIGAAGGAAFGKARKIVTGES